MNSLNILSGFTATPATTPPSTPPSRSRTGSSADIHGGQAQDGAADFGSIAEKLGEKVPWMGRAQDSDEKERRGEERIQLEPEEDDEKKPLLARDASDEQVTQQKRGWRVHRRLADAIINSAVTVVRVVYTTLTAPKRWVVACFYDEDGQFSAMMPFRQFRALMAGRRRRKSAMQGVAEEQATEVTINDDRMGGSQSERPRREPKLPRRTSSRRSPSVSSISSATSDATSEGEPETEADRISDSPARHTRSKTSAAASRDEIKPQNKSIRIKLHAPTDPALQRRKERKAQEKARDASSDSTTLANSLKSPSSPTTSNPKTLTRYPRTPAPPRPLVPRRQPSYSLTYSNDAPRKTLVIDLDETLIHSMAKGGRMSQGHMVEVRLSYTSPTNPVTSASPSNTPPPSIQGVPILYYVHERPYVHDFLRKVAKWYNLIIFTASVQEYADPVIDYLERERKYFSGRYYRQHCTYRNGAYIKDLAAVEPDLSRVMILDNSPMSYIFHEDNALPIEGWISDPTDHELLHLVSLLEGLQYVTDVRALLALRQGLPGGFAQQA